MLLANRNRHGRIKADPVFRHINIGHLLPLRRIMGREPTLNDMTAPRASSAFLSRDGMSGVHVTNIGVLQFALNLRRDQNL
jgi:hypothetical protein